MTLFSYQEKHDFHLRRNFANIYVCAFLPKVPAFAAN